MQVQRISTPNGIDDIKLIGETDSERLFIKQLAEAGTLSCTNREVSSTVVFRPISVFSEIERKSANVNEIGKYDFSMRQNEDYTMDLTFVKDGVAINLNEFDGIKLQVKKGKSSNALLSFSLDSGLEIKGESNNVLGVTFTKDQTKTLNCQEYYYDVMMVLDDKNDYYLEGKITVRQSITR